LKKVVIVSAKRTPIGSFLGELSSLSATQLGSFAIKTIIEEAGLQTNQIDEVIMGNVLSSGLGQAPARQAAIYAGLNSSTECLTINKMCGSGLKAVMLADQAIRNNDANTIIAGGFESMSNAPYLLPKARAGLRLGNNEVVDSVLIDGLTDVYDKIHMGECAEYCAKDYSITRQELDNYAIDSYKKARDAQRAGRFKQEIAELQLNSKEGNKIISEDEEPKKVNFDKISNLKPAFVKNGVVTAANSSKINDGAAAVLVMTEEKALSLGLQPLVEIISHCSFAKKPLEFTTAPADVIPKLLAKAKLSIADINLFEINEAFAVVTVVTNKILQLDVDKVNVNGGAIALGHPIGASGARILVTLIHELKRKDLEYGIASLCIGGGEASALLIKNYN